MKVLFNHSIHTPAPRRLKGLVAPYEQAGYASTGNTVIHAGALHLPEDLSRVKLLLDHDHASPIGYAISATDTETGLEMEFELGNSPRAEEAISHVKARTRDGLSVGINALSDGTGITVNAGQVDVTAAEVYEVSLVAIPAFADARVTELIASRKETPAMEEPKEKQEMPTNDTPTNDAPAAALPRRATPADPSLEAVTAALAPVYTPTARAAELTAALSDIVPANDKAGQLGPNMPAYLGKLWETSRIDRPFIDAITHKPLTSMKVIGWKWDEKPTVGPYAGNKTDIPTSNITTKKLEATAKRIAGGWDIDRIFSDFGESQVINTIFEYAVDDYRMKVEAAVAKEIATQATAVKGSPKTTLDALAQVATEAARINANLSFVAVSSEAWGELAAMKKNDIPWWLQGSMNLTGEGTVSGVKIFVSPTLEGKTILAGDKRAATFFEKPPIRVDAIDLPRGGIDLGLFGYYAVLVEAPEAIFKATVTAPGVGG